MAASLLSKVDVSDNARRNLVFGGDMEATWAHGHGSAVYRGLGGSDGLLGRGGTSL